VDKITDILQEQDFYRYEHRIIFHHIARLIEHAKPVDVITVAESLESNAELDKAVVCPILVLWRRTCHQPPIFAAMQKLCANVR